MSTDSEYSSEALAIVVEIVAPALGVLLAIVLFVGPLPAVLAVRKANDLGRMNALLFPCTLANCLGNTLYGVAKEDPYLITANGFGIIISVFYLLTSIRLAHQASTFHILELMTYIFVILWIGLGIVARYVPEVAEQVLGVGAMCMSLIMFTAPLSTVREVIREHNSVSINMGFLIGQIASSFMWIIYAGFTKDMFVLIPNLFGLVLGLIQAALVVILPRKATPELDMKTEFELGGTTLGGASHPPSVGETVMSQYPEYQNYEVDSMAPDDRTPPAITAITDEQAAHMPLMNRGSISHPDQYRPYALSQEQQGAYIGSPQTIGSARHLVPMGGPMPPHHLSHTQSQPPGGSSRYLRTHESGYSSGTADRGRVYSEVDHRPVDYRDRGMSADRTRSYSARDLGYSPRERGYSSNSAHSGPNDRLAPGVHKAPLDRDSHLPEPQSDHSTDDSNSVPPLDSPPIRPTRTPQQGSPGIPSDVHIMPPLPENTQQLPPSSMYGQPAPMQAVQTMQYQVQPGVSMHEQQVQDRANMLKQQEMERQQQLILAAQQQQQPPMFSSSIPQIQSQMSNMPPPPPGMQDPNMMGGMLPHQQMQQGRRPDLNISTTYQPPSMPTMSREGSFRGTPPSPPSQPSQMGGVMQQSSSSVRPTPNPSPMQQPVPVPPALGGDNNFSLTASAYNPQLAGLGPSASQRRFPTRASSQDMIGSAREEQRQRAASMAVTDNSQQ